MIRRGGVTVRDERIDDLVKCNRKVESRSYGNYVLKVGNEKFSFKTNAFVPFDYGISSHKVWDMPQAWAEGGYIGITLTSDGRIKSMGTPYFAENKKFSNIAISLKEKGLNVVIDSK